MAREGFQKPLSEPGKRDVRLARISYRGDGVVCSCGWAFVHTREKVREDAVDRHLARRHGKRGLRL